MIETLFPDPGSTLSANNALVYIQAVLDGFRARGRKRPVMILLHDERAFTLPLPADAVHLNIRNPGSPVKAFVVGVQQARTILAHVCDPDFVKRQFRTPQWPIGYWTVDVYSTHVAVRESQTRVDEMRARDAEAIGSTP